MSSFLEDLVEFQNVSRTAINTLRRLGNKRPKELKKDLEKKANAVIQNWYFSYNPHRRYYKYQESLYHAYKITQNGIEISIDWSSRYLDEAEIEHNQSNEIVYNNAFVSGYHGGSMGTDRNHKTAKTPKWRTPMPWLVDEEGEAWERWSRRHTARTTPSPRDKLDSISEELFEEYTKQWERDIDKVLGKIEDVVKKIEKGVR